MGVGVITEKTGIGPRIQVKLMQVFPDVHHSKPSNFELTGQSRRLLDKGFSIAARKCF